MSEEQKVSPELQRFLIAASEAEAPRYCCRCYECSVLLLFDLPSHTIIENSDLDISTL
jgi:hypothetical protein